ncbi:MAG TPA: NAD(P)/FAD-dependent oxidoreductase [Candidatus Binataceae bacterium]|nr:NAD(P)/FAD-dependent oxidoreductase [Candidatus Binataceae bacterium]
MPLSVPSGETVIVGAGPSGLTAAYELCKARAAVTVLEADPEKVGGLSRTVEYKGFRFDIGGHRFFSKNSLVEEIWTDILGERMLERDRLSRIYYRGVLFKYPLEVLDVLRKLGPLESAACVLSYVRSHFSSAKDVRTFEDWVTRAFGRRLYEIFFKTYTEKVWGIPCSSISADWAAQRIRGLSIPALFKAAIRWPGSKDAPIIKTLIDRFRYPARGPGEMWETMASRITAMGAKIKMGERATVIERDNRRVIRIVTEDPQGNRYSYSGDHFISTMPIRALIEAFQPAVPHEILQAARGLSYRDFITVALVLNRPELFPDQWIYIHDPQVKVGRIQNFKNWSPAMVSDSRYSVLGLEYFCFDSDQMWRAPDAELIAMAKRELALTGLADESSVVDAAVVREVAAYPIYDHDYRGHVASIRRFLELEAPNLQLAGRNGMHKYNNQDHAMMTGIMAARNLMGANYDQWRVNADALYLEDDNEPGDGSRLIPMSVAADEIPPPGDS